MRVATAASGARTRQEASSTRAQTMMERLGDILAGGLLAEGRGRAKVQMEQAPGQGRAKARFRLIRVLGGHLLDRSSFPSSDRDEETPMATCRMPLARVWAVKAPQQGAPFTSRRSSRPLKAPNRPPTDRPSFSRSCLTCSRLVTSAARQHQSTDSCSGRSALGRQQRQQRLLEECRRLGHAACKDCEAVPTPNEAAVLRVRVGPTGGAAPREGAPSAGRRADRPSQAAFRRHATQHAQHLPKQRF